MNGRFPAVNGTPHLEVTSLGSGSSGNALLVRTSSAAVLVDCGISFRRLTHALQSHALRLDDIDAILISHEHGDHVREVRRFTPLETPVLSTKGTAAAAFLPRQHCQSIAREETRTLANIEITAIPVAHDAAEPCGFLIKAEGSVITVLTDLGSPSAFAADAVAAADLVVLEANHDVGMLRRGPYPAHLQRRILSDVGHLSNDDCGQLLVTALARSSRLPTVWLAHLSETNNRPRLATEAVRRHLVREGIMLEVIALPRRDVGPTWKPGQARTGAAQLRLDLA